MTIRIGGVCLALLVAGASLSALAQEPPTFGLEIRNHVYSPAELRVPAGRPLLLKIRNLDTTAEEFESLALKIEKVIAGGAEGLVRIGALAPGRYEFVGEFHPETARGVLIAE